eukprot:Opistho-2@9152
MPLMPAMRPFSNTNSAAARPISRPPLRAAMGVKSSQAMLIQDLLAGLERDGRYRPGLGLGCQHHAITLQQLGMAGRLRVPQALLDGLGRPLHVHRVDQAQAQGRGEKEAVLLVEPARLDGGVQPRVALQLQLRIDAPDPGRRLELQIDALRPVLDPCTLR